MITQQDIDKNSGIPDDEIRKDIRDTIDEIVNLRLRIAARERFVKKLEELLKARGIPLYPKLAISEIA